MRTLFFGLLMLMFTSLHTLAQTQPLTRAAPMGERTSLYGFYPYESDNKKVSFPYFLLGPENAQQGARYPLIVVLHGRSGHAYGGWVLAQKVLKEGLPAFVMVPMMEDHVTDWMGNFFRKQDKEYPRPIDHVALLTKKLVRELPIDADRLYITGYSMGGVGTFGMLAAHPDLFAAAIPICGAWYPEQAAKFVNFPLWAFHGTADRFVPVRETRAIIAAIKKAGGHPRYTEYPKVDHNSWIPAYNEPEIWTWLLSQKKSR